jgi:hypothetical protein
MLQQPSGCGLYCLSSAWLLRMSVIGSLLLLAISAGVMVLPRNLAPVALIAGLIYLTKGDGLSLGSITLHSHRVLLLAALVRVTVRSEWHEGGLTTIDRLVVLGSVWTLFVSVFQPQEPGSGLVNALGGTFALLSAYFVVRAWCRDVEDLNTIVAGLALLLLPVAISMTFEKLLGKNIFAVLGGAQEIISREGVIRARGPFRHPILAGTIGAACVPLMLGLFRQRPISAMIGVGSALAIVGACHSSGPIVSLLVGVGILAAWRWRRHARAAVWLGVVAYIAIDLISNRRGYEAIVTRLDLTGSSTAFYRARLIKTTLAHFNEWWLIGTDYTRHWIPSGIGSVVLDGRHIDVTNMYIARGINDGLVGMMILIVTIIYSVRQTVILANHMDPTMPRQDVFFIWAMGATLGSLAVSGLSVSYFDQSSSFIWLLVAWIASTASVRASYSSSELPQAIGPMSGQCGSPLETSGMGSLGRKA